MTAVRFKPTKFQNNSDGLQKTSWDYESFTVHRCPVLPGAVPYWSLRACGGGGTGGRRGASAHEMTSAPLLF